MELRYFLDTDIFIQSFDQSDPEKKKRADALIGAALVNHVGIISSHVISEFLQWSLHKFPVPLQYRDARDYLEQVLLPLQDVTPDPDYFRTALSYQERLRCPMGDALVLAGAHKGKCRVVYSTRFKPGLVISSVVCKNPFSMSS